MNKPNQMLSGRTLCFFCAAYTFGIAFYAFFSSWFFALAAAFLAFTVAAAIKKVPQFLIILIIFTAFFGGVAHFYIVSSVDKAFTEKYTRRYVTISGRVTNTSTDGENQNIIILTNSLSILGKKENKKLYVSLCTDTEKKFKTGDKVSFSDILSPQDKSSAHSFDYGLFLHTKNISASFWVPSANITASAGELTFSDKIKLFSLDLSNKIRTATGGEEGEVASAVVLGDRSGFTDELNNIFAKSGISHIVAVSGMNLSVLIGFFFALASKSKLHYKIRNIFGILIVFFYMALTGFSASVNRAGIMTVCVLIAAILDRKEDLATGFFLSSAIILSVNPYSIFDAGFLLSYSALAGILIFFKPLREKRENLPRIIPKALWDIAATSFCASLFTYPILAYFFNSVSLISVFTNIIVVPLVNTVFVSLLIVALFTFIYSPLAAILALFPKYLLKFILFAARAMASIPYGSIYVKSPSLLTFVCFMLLLILFYRVLTGKKAGKSGAVILAAAIIIGTAVPILSSFTYSVTFFDIGQGDCALIKAPFGRSCLIDTGANEKVTLAALKSAGVNNLDVIFISHPDADHSGALEKILSTFPTNTVVFPNYNIMGEDLTGLSKKAVKSGSDVHFANSFYSYNIPGGLADILWPSQNILPYDDNSGSLVLNLDIKGNKFLFTGDIDSAAENAIIKSREPLDCDVLKVAHHGSSYSSNESFLKEASAEYFVISAGKNNKYGHPHEETLLRLENAGKNILRTDQSGDIVFIIDLFGNMRVKNEAK